MQLEVVNPQQDFIHINICQQAKYLFFARQPFTWSYHDLRNFCTELNTWSHPKFEIRMLIIAIKFADIAVVEGLRRVGNVVVE